jgi:hypothetical protein
VTCTITNTRTSAPLILQKTWVNGAAADTAALAVSGSDPATSGSASSTATGAAGSETDPVNRATATIFSGQTVNLAETLGAGNTGSYTSQIACDQSWDGRRCAGSRRGSVHGTRNDAAVVTNPLSLAAVVSSAHGSRSAEFCSVLTTWEMWPSHSTWGSTVGLLIYTPDRTIRLRRPPILAERNRDSRAVRSGRIPAVEGI